MVPKSRYSAAASMYGGWTCSVRRRAEISTQREATSISSSNSIRAPDAYVDAFFGLKEGYEQLFGRPVDLVSAASIRNPYFRQSVERTKALLYAA